ncbi:ABC transporter ATP-binding protein [Gordonia spumicola]|uniref:ABC transporter ATP-binding protein n=1 Tax=Gordonia spumicola TaxID=589161 RepID=A0A7I9VFF3_9ACTN|nr:ABC transporter ATP-binding protein [Gordonia spumicola]GEE03843.1 ABC transporter ATP-binding protein [Gordonia spumicola]
MTEPAVTASTPTAPTVTVRGATVRLSSATLLHDVSCTAPAGRVTGLIGPNGSGKTTLLSLIARWRAPSTGSVHIDDTRVDSIGRRDYARRVAVVEQHSGTELDLTVEQVVGLGSIPHRGGWASPSAVHDVQPYLRAMGLDDLRLRTWRTLSGGERQKTQVARALAQRPDVLVLDEPTNHLDPAAALDLMDGVRRSGRTTVVALHDLALAAAYCDRLVVLAAGRVVAEGPPEKVLTTALLADVYGLDADVIEHPRTGRPLIVPCGTVR